MRRAFLSFLIAAAPLAAQSPLPADILIYASPTSGSALGMLKHGTSVRTGKADGGWTPVFVEGWLLSSRLTERKDSLDRAITGKGTVPLRRADGASQQLLADIEAGTSFKRLSERNGWTQVRRTAWMRSTTPKRGTNPPASTPAPALRASAPAPRTPPAAPPAAAAPQSAQQLPAGMQRAVHETKLRSSPGGEERATVRAGTSVETLAHEGGWARVRIEGWVSERDLMVADSDADAGLSAADLRAQPSAYRGKVVRWEVQVISLERADPLRKGLVPDEPYLLVRGPGKENATLYIAIPPSLVEQARAIPQLSNVLITARVREGRSQPVGVPVLDLMSFTRLP
jgi:hypothetical protein